MEAFTKTLKNPHKIIINEEIDNFLKNEGKEVGCGCYGDEEVYGWEIQFYSLSGLYIRLIVNGEKMRYYEEYDCGGLINTFIREENFKDMSVENFCKFIDKMGE